MIKSNHLFQGLNVIYILILICTQEKSKNLFLFFLIGRAIPKYLSANTYCSLWANHRFMYLILSAQQL